MAHADDTIHYWHEIGWSEDVIDRWEAFFTSLIDQPLRAEALCVLGMRVVHGELKVFPQSASPQWLALFSLLAGRFEAADDLCHLGLQMVRCELSNPRSYRSQAMTVLHAARGKRRTG